MSDKTLQLVATIRDETDEAANTATRIGQCLESIVREHDTLANRFPADRIAPSIIGIESLDLMTSAEYVQADYGTYFGVIRKDLQGRALLVGHLQLFSDSMHHVITQVFVTHEILDETGRFAGAHDHRNLYHYTRSFGFSASGTNPAYPNMPNQFPLHDWGPWRRMVALPPSYGTIGMDGLMSGQDKGKLDAMTPLAFPPSDSPEQDFSPLYYFDSRTTSETLSAFFAEYPIRRIADAAASGAAIFFEGRKGKRVFVRVCSSQCWEGNESIKMEYDNIVLNVQMVLVPVGDGVANPTYTVRRLDLNKTYITL